MKKNLILLFTFSLLLSCKEKSPVPNISEDIFVQILVDMHIAEEMITKFKESHRDSVRQLFLHEISTIHSIDSSTITQELEIIQANPEYAFSIYEKVYKKIDRIDNIKTEKSNKN